MGFLETLFRGAVDGTVAHYKKKEASKRPDGEDYVRLINDPFLADSEYLNYLVDYAEYNADLDYVHAHMNKFQDRIDIYGVPNYMKVSQKIIERKGGWK